MTALRIRPEAERDVDLAAEHCAREGSLDVALRFLAAVDETLEQLVEHPHSGTLVKAFDPKLETLRFRSVAGFANYLVFYWPIVGCVEVIRILHGAQDLRRILSAPAGDGRSSESGGRE